MPFSREAFLVVCHISLLVESQVTVTPDNVDSIDSITITLPNTATQVVNGLWQLNRPVTDWSIAMELAATDYSFHATETSRIVISIDDIACGPQDRGRDQCDQFYAFGVDDLYMTFVHDLDNDIFLGDLPGSPGPKGGLFAFPNCNAGLPMASGDAATLLQGVNDTFDSLRFAVGNGTNPPSLFSSGSVNDSRPLTFTFINDPVGDTFTVSFQASPSYDTPIECTFEGALPTCNSFRWFNTLDTNDFTGQNLTSFTVDSENTECITLNPTRDPTRDPTGDPTLEPTRDPTNDPTRDPTADPSSDPTRDPTGDPTADPSRDPTLNPTRDPTSDPTATSFAPTRDPTLDPTRDPTADPTELTDSPSGMPSTSPLQVSTSNPSVSPVADSDSVDSSSDDSSGNGDSGSGSDSDDSGDNAMANADVTDDESGLLYGDDDKYLEENVEWTVSMDDKVVTQVLIMFGAAAVLNGSMLLCFVYKRK